MVDARWRWNGGLVGILTEQNLRFDVARQRRLGPHLARGTDHDHHEGDDRGADDEANDERDHAGIVPNGRMHVVAKPAAPEWWNGRHDGLKIRCSQGREGSNPSSGTTLNCANA